MFVLQKRLLPVLYHMHGSQGRRGPFTLSVSVTRARQLMRLLADHVPAMDMVWSLLECRDNGGWGRTLLALMPSTYGGYPWLWKLHVIHSERQ
jgi:hypothetical protein